MDIKIVDIDRSNINLFKDILFEPVRSFSNNPERIGLMDGSTPCGTAVYTLSEGSLMLHTFYIHMEYRHQGLGTLLMNRLFEIGKERGCLFITTNIYHIQKWMTALLLSTGFIITPEPGVFYLSVSEAVESKTVQKYLYNKTYKGTCKSYYELNEGEKTQFKEFLSKFDYPLLNLKEPGFQYELSYATFSPDGALTGAMVSFAFQQQLIIDYLMGTGKDNTFMLLMFRRLIDTLRAIPNSEEMMILFQAENNSAISLAEKLLDKPLKETDHVCHAVRELF